MSRLAQERSPYLRHAADQLIDWYPWSDEPFERARQEGKPLFLSSGGVWCHWCHVMAKETFHDEETARLLNELFISIKIDRDERPDIDRRYQQAVAAMGNGGGWPLSVFLTPDRKVFFGGTYFPPEDIPGRPGFKKVLKAVSDYYGTKREEVERYAGRVMEVLAAEPARSGELDRSSLDAAASGMLAHFDEQSGGFGTSPKFPMPGALEFLAHRFSLTRRSEIGLAVRKTLVSMASGGFQDHLAGGFHRYSTDAAWIVPHFEKMADDNAWLLRNYLEAYALFGDDRFRSTAEGIIRFTSEVLADPAGGFFASQDADVTPDDEGGYFTWTDADFRRTLAPDEYQVLSRHLLHERGAMQHDRDKKVLHISMTAQDIAQDLDRPLDEVEGLIRSGKEKLLRERLTREAPYTDRTLYTALNGMYIASWFRAFGILGDASLKEFGIKSLERVLRERIVGSELYHAEGVTAVLDDHVHLIEALVAAYEATGDRQYLDRAGAMMAACMEKFGDPAGGFFDTEKAVLGARLKRIEDLPHPSANAAAIRLLIKLHHLGEKSAFLQAAEQALAAFSGSAQEYSIHAGAYFSALESFFHTVTLTVSAGPDSELAKAARALAGPPLAILYGADEGCVTPCFGNTCFEPINDPAQVRAFIRKLPQT